MLCNHAALIEEKGKYHVDGDPTEGALLVSGMKAGLSRDHLLQEYRIIQEFPFDSSRKMMTVIVEDKKDIVLQLRKALPIF